SRDLTRIIEVTRAISASDGPLKPLMKAIDREVTLSVPPGTDPSLSGRVAEKAQQYAGRARQAITGTAPGVLEKELGDDKFDGGHRLAGPPGATGPAPVDALVQQLNDFYQLLVSAKTALDTAQTLPPMDAANKLRAEAARLPEPLRAMIQGLLDAGAGQVLD